MTDGVKARTECGWRTFRKGDAWTSVSQDGLENEYPGNIVWEKPVTSEYIEDFADCLREAAKYMRRKGK